MPRKIFVAGEILTAADVNTNLMDQAVMVFDDDAARTTAIPTPSEGMVTYLKDTNLVEAYTGAAFTPVGTILQVVSTAKTDTFSTSSGTFVDVTGMTATITPSSDTSKVLVIANFFGSNSANHFSFWNLRRDSTNIAQPTGGTDNATVSAYGGIAGWGDTITIVFLDSPASSSAVTYGLQTKIGGGGTTFVGRSSNSDARNHSTITVMEVAG